MFSIFKKISLTLCLIASLSSLVLAQDDADTTTTIDPWKTGGVFSLNFTQVSLTNWAAGGNSSISGTTLFSSFANYKKGKSQWDNSLELAYGLLREKNRPVVKSDDRIDISSKYGRESFVKNVNYSTMLNFRTQFDEGFANAGDSVRISKFLAPAYITLAIGLDYKPNDNFTALISPLAGKVTIVNDQQLANAGAFGVQAEERDGLGNIITESKMVRYEFGAYIRSQYKKEIFENITYSTRLELFTNYIEEFGNIDVNWENLISMKVNKYVTVTFSTMLIYDDDINIVVKNDDGVITGEGPRIQFKQVLGVGLSYNFKN